MARIAVPYLLLILHITAPLRVLQEPFVGIVATCISFSIPPCILTAGMSQRLLTSRWAVFGCPVPQHTNKEQREFRSGCDPAMRRLRNNQSTALGRARHWTKGCMPLLGEHNRNKDPFVIMVALDSLLCAIGNASLSLLKGMLVGQEACKSLPRCTLNA